MTASEIACMVCARALGPSRKLSGLLLCPGCGFLTADLAQEVDFEKLYGPDYFNGGEYLDYLGDAPSLARNFRDRAKALCSLVPDAGQKALLEIGCAYGLFLQEAKSVFRSVEGVDIAAEAVEHARSRLDLPLHHGDYLGMDFKGRFDVAVLWDTVEHLEHPDRYLKKIAEEIRPGGFVALTTGDIGSLNARMRGRRWRMIHPPTHMHYFSASTMRLLLAEYGFEVVHLRHPANARVARSMLYIMLVLRMRWSRLYHAIQGWRVWDISIPLNLFDIMFVVARKK